MLGVRRADVVHRSAGKFRSRLHDAVIRVYAEAGNVIETHEQAAGERACLHIIQAGAVSIQFDVCSRMG